MTHLTFKQYLESREQLLKAIENTPITILEYDIRKYCTIPIGESSDEKQLISLKPKNKIIVEWNYENIDNPQPVSIKFPGINEEIEDEQFSTFWTGQKLNKWLMRYANKGNEIYYHK